MENILIDKLNKVKNLDDRRLLKEVILGTVLELSKYQNQINKSVEERVFNEVKKNEGNYSIYFTVNKRENIDLLDEFLFPIFSEEIENNYKKSLENEEKIISTVFIKENFQNIEKNLKLNQTFTGEIKTNLKTYDISFKLRKNTKYLEEIENLHKVFIVNNIRWKTVNASYLNKFLDVVLIEEDIELESEEEIESVDFFFGEYESLIEKDIVPLWNLKKETINCSTFPVPTLDKINYEHTIVLAEDYIYTGYLINNLDEELAYVKHIGNEIIVVCPDEKSTVWDVMKIVQPKVKNFSSYPYNVISNSTKENFINYYSLHNSSHIKTKSEIKRLLSSFDVSKFIEIVDIVIDFDKKDYENNYYNMNYFFVDSSIVEDKKPIMLITFKLLNDENYIISDYISFLISNLQTYFPEYKCVGKKI